MVEVHLTQLWDLTPGNAVTFSVHCHHLQVRSVPDMVACNPARCGWDYVHATSSITWCYRSTRLAGRSCNQNGKPWAGFESLLLVLLLFLVTSLPLSLLLLPWLLLFDL